MPRLPYRPEHFGLHMGEPFTQLSEIDFTWDELCWAALTVGRRNWSDVIRHGTYSVLEGLWRIAMVRANLVEESDGRLGKSEAFVALDPSERGAVSFFLGLVLTKLLAERLFQVPWLLHLDVYRTALNPSLALPLKPDFVGMDAFQQWVVIESKGRTGTATVNVMSHGKRQTRSLRNLDGHLPALRAVVGTYFSSGMLRARVWDPDEYNEDAVDLPIQPEALVREYYKPIVEFVEEFPRVVVQPTVEQKTARVSPIVGLDASVRLDEEIVLWYRGEGPAWNDIVKSRKPEISVVAELAELRRTPEAERIRVLQRDPRKRAAISQERLWARKATGVDGVTVELGESWDPEIMRRQPKDRSR